MQVVSKHRLLSIFTDQVHEAFFVLHVDQLSVNARLDVNDCRIIESSCLRHSIDCFLDRFELAGTVRCDVSGGMKAIDQKGVR